METPDSTAEREIFAAAAALTLAERAAYLDSTCVGRPELRANVEAWLGAHEPSEFMQAPEEDSQMHPEQAGERIGNYKLLEKIGEGGFGTVWVADQERPVRRQVALKIIKLGMDTKEVVARFGQERQALAMMDHPHIAKVLDAGATEWGRPYFVMELVRGIKITDYCDQAKLSTADRLTLFIQVCQAVQHAHQKGIIHRDLKPSNILVTLHDGVPMPKVIDFGVAKATQQQRLTDLTIYTEFQQMIGTPVYMSPEQAEMSGLDIDTRSDIYSLGVLLYELLTGRTPFDPAELMRKGYDEIRRAIREQEPQTPSVFLRTMPNATRASVAQHRQSDPAKLTNLVRGDLDWIIMKALEKDRGRRYATANGLAMDIQRHLANEPVTAAAPRLAYLFRKFARRNQKSLGVAGLIAAMLVAATGISVWQAKLAIAAKKEAAEALGEVGRKKAEVDRKNTEQRAMLVEAARSDSLFGEENSRAGKEREAFAHFARACEYDPRSKLAAEKATAALNNWQHPLPKTILAGHLDSGMIVQISQDGTRIVTSRDTNTWVWDTATGKKLVTLAGHSNLVMSARFSPDGARIVTASWDKTARVWDTATGKSLVTLAGHEGGVSSAQFSRNGTRVVTASYDKTARVWETGTGKSIVIFAGHDVRGAHFNPDGSRIITVSDNTAWVWDATTGKNLATFAGHENTISIARFSPDGSRIVTASADTTARVWDAATGKTLATFAEHESYVGTAQFSPDGARIVTASLDKTARVWDAATGKIIITLAEHGGGVYSAWFSPDGTSIVTASSDKTARVWDAATGKILATLVGHEGEVNRAFFSADGKYIVTAASDKTARVWDAVTAKSLPALRNNRTPRSNVQISPDGALVISASMDLSNYNAWVWDAATGKKLTTLKGHQEPVETAQFSPDASRIVTASMDETVRVWETATGKSLATFEGHKDGVYSAQFSPDGLRIVTASADKTARVWDATTGKTLSTLAGHESYVESAQFSPDGTRIVTISEDKTARVWDAATGKSLVTLAGHESRVTSAQFSSDGARVVTVSAARAWGPDIDKSLALVRVWDTATGVVLCILYGHQLSAQFSRDDKLIVTASADTTALVWDAATGRILSTLVGHEAGVNSAQFSRDGRRIVTASADKTARLWDVATGKSLATLAGHEKGVDSAQFNQDGTHIVTASEDETARVWTTLSCHAGAPPEWFPDFLRYMAQMRLNSEGELETLKTDDWLALRERMRAVRRASAGQNTPYLLILRRFVPE